MSQTDGGRERQTDTAMNQQHKDDNGSCDAAVARENCTGQREGLDSLTRETPL